MRSGDVKGDCQFCKGYQLYQNIHRFNQEHPEYNGNEKLYYEVNVAIVVRSWLKGRKSHAARITDYRYRGIGYKLNYCPECGRKL